MIENRQRSDLLRRSQNAVNQRSVFTDKPLVGLHESFWKAYVKVFDAGSYIDFTPIAGFLPLSDAVLRELRVDGPPPSKPWLCDCCHAPSETWLDLPNFSMGHGLQSTNGWALCVECKRLVDATEGRELLKRSLAAIPKHLRTPETVLEITELHARFWSALLDAKTGLHDTITSEIRGLDSKIAALTSVLPAPSFTSSSAPWMDALDAQFEALRLLKKVLDTGVGDPAIRQSWKNDAVALQVAEAYSFSGDAWSAIQAAAASVPHDCVLAGEQVPGSGQGWWWFTPPLELQTEPTSASSASALLWGFVHPNARGAVPLGTYPADTDIRKIFAVEDPDESISRKLAAEAFLIFSVYVRQPTGELSPSTEWRWYQNETIHDVLTRTALEYRANPSNTHPGYGEKQTLSIIASLSAIFLAAASWIEHDIIERVPGHVERHAAKRLQREHKLKDRPSRVHVIALRRKRFLHEGEPVTQEGETPGEAAAKRSFSCNWVVDRHWRKQAYGPGRTQRKLIVIESYPKGPADKPFKAKPKKVFAVIR
jgi:hypothetical protein